MIQDNPNRIPVNRKLLARFFKNVRIDPSITFNGSPCWLWIKPSSGGYGAFSCNSYGRKAHRIAFEMFDHIIENPNNEADHLCRNRACVNPAHIEDVPQFINNLRGDGPAARNARKTHCDSGHEFTEENTFQYGPDKRFRSCKACRKIAAAEKWRREHPERTHCKNGHPYTTPPVGAGNHRCILCVKTREKARVRNRSRKDNNRKRAIQKLSP